MNFGERERERERETETQSAPFARPSSSRRRSQAPAPSIAIQDRELAFAPIAIGAVLREIAPSIAIDAVRDCAADCDLAKRCGASRDRDRQRGRRTGAREAPRRRMPSIASVNLGAVFVFLVLSFSL